MNYITRRNRWYDIWYSNRWYNINPKITKDLLPILTRDAKPVFLTADKIFPMTMATSCSVSY